MRKALGNWLWRHFRPFMLKRHGMGNNIVGRDDVFLDLFLSVRKEGRAILGIREIYNLYRLVAQTAKIPGDLAEVGVYRGGSARVICAAKGDRQLYLFDTFAGLPAADPGVDRHAAGAFAGTSLAEVTQYLVPFPNLVFLPGVFPDSAGSLPPDTRFAFVHLDVDLYESTLRALNYFYPRMSRGGVILSHDYRSLSCPGVRRSWDEFFADKPEPIIELWDTQALMIKF